MRVRFLVFPDFTESEDLTFEMSQVPQRNEEVRLIAPDNTKFTMRVASVLWIPDEDMALVGLA